jgi:hypothetical protein
MGQNTNFFNTVIVMRIQNLPSSPRAGIAIAFLICCTHFIPHKIRFFLDEYEYKEYKLKRKVKKLDVVKKI